MKNKFINGLLLVLVMSFTSCYDDLEVGGTETQNMSGDWWVQLLIDDGAGNWVDGFGVGYFHVSTYNTAANTSSEMWLDDHGFWPYKAKVPINYDSQTFSAVDLADPFSDPDLPVTATIMDGKILDDVATTSGGNQSDSIHYRIEWSDYPGVDFMVAGYRRTGFAEDEH